MDREEFNSLYAASFPRLVGQLYAMTGDQAEAQDAVQEAFVRAWVHRGRQAHPHPDPRRPPVRHDRALTSSVSNLRVFGSVARGEDRPDSDVDLLADLPAHMGLFGLGRVQAELEAILDARVDLVPAGALKPNVRSRAERELVAL